MSDDEPLGEGGTALLYDHMKHLTSLCLLSLGGVVALTDKLSGAVWKSVIVAVAVIGAAALSAFVASSMLVEARYDGKPLNRHITFYRHASPLLLSVGVGMFLYLFLKSLKP